MTTPDQKRDLLERHRADKRTLAECNCSCAMCALLPGAVENATALTESHIARMEHQSPREEAGR